jgi:multiple sugar transport system substrate-binding protein
MQQKTRGVFYFLLISLSFFAASCSGVSTPGPEDPAEKVHAGVTLRVCCPDELTHTLLTEMSKGWVHRTGLRPPDVVEAIAGVPDEKADLWILPACSILRWADRLTPLPGELLARSGPFRWNGLLPIYREQLLRWHNETVAVPLLGDAPFCFYRKDLFADPRHRAGYEQQTRHKLEAPATWDDYAAIAEYFRDNREPGKRQPSLTGLPSRDEELDRLFYTVAASTARLMLDAEDEEGKHASDDDLFAFHFDLETGTPRIATHGFVVALQVLQRLQACRPTEPAVVSWKAFLDGKAVMCLGDARLIGAFQAANSLRDKVGVCRVPGSRVCYSGPTGQKQTLREGRINRIPYLGAGAYVLAVPRSSPHPDIAFELLEELGGRERGQQIVLDSRWGGGATRLEHLDERFDSWRLPAEEADRARSLLRDTLQSTVRNPLVCLRLPREQEFRAILTARLRNALVAGKASTDEGTATVLQEVARQWEELIKRQPAEHRRDYRRSLGLTR